MIIRFFEDINKEINVDLEVPVLEIESKTFMQVLTRQMLGQECNDVINIEINKKEVSLKNILYISNIIEYDLCNKNIITKVYKELAKRISFEGAFEQQRMRIIDSVANIENIINKDEILFDTNCDFEIIDLFKFVNLFPVKTDVLRKKVISIIDICAEYSICDVIIFNHLKDYLFKEDLEEIYKYSLYRRKQLLLIENKHTEELISYEKKIWIDEDDYMV